MNKEPQSLIRQKRLTTLYLCYMLLAFVLGYHDHFFDISQTKLAIYLYGTGAYLIFMLFCALTQLSSIKPKKPSLPTLSLGLLALSSLPALIGNIDPVNSFWGLNEKYTGLLLYLLGWASIYCISRTFEWDGLLLKLFVAVSLIEYTFQILNRFSIDPLGMYENMVASEIPAFLGTLGHINYNSSFDCIMLALNLVFFLNSKEKRSRILYGFCMFWGFCGAVCCNCDSVFLSIAAIYAAAAWYCCAHPDTWRRLWVSACLFVLASTLIAVLYAACADAVEFMDGSTAFTRMPVLLAEYAFLLISGVVIFRFKDVLTQKQKLLKKLFSFGILAGIALGVLFIIYKASDITFASGRGLIWQKCLALFCDAPIFRKLFGYGFNNIRLVLEAAQGDAFDISGSDVIMDAHNIFLNTLLSSGLIGLALWGVLLSSLLIKGVRLCENHPNALFVVIGISTYLVQGLVNGPQVITTPVFLTELGVLWGIVNNSSTCPK